MKQNSLSRTRKTSYTANSKRKDLATWERFLARSWELERQGKPYDHWRRAAFILWQIETDQDVGHHRRRQNRGAS